VPGGVAAFYRNVSERMQAEEALRLSEERLRTAFAISTVGVLFWDKDFSLTEVNDAFLRMTGFSRDEAVGKTWQELTPEEFHPESWRAIEQVTTRGEASPYEKQYFRRDGSRWWGLFASRKVGDEFVEFVVDITDRKETEAALRRLNEELESRVLHAVTERERSEAALRQSQKLEAVGQLTGGVAHDFNNLLTVIKTYSEFMLEQIEDGSSLRADAIEIQKAAGRAAALTRQLLAFSRKQVLDTRSIDVNEIVREMEPMRRRLIGEHIRVELHLASSLGAVKADAGQLEQVVLNLAVNARDAMPEGGSLTIETSEVTLTETMRGGHGVIPGPYISLAVRDTGCGMDRATRARVFEPFFTTKEQGRGTGLGLSTVYGIVKQSEGYIWCDSTEGEGTTFTVLLPHVPAEAHAAEQPPESAPDRGSGVVLITEDEDTIRALSRRILEREGYTVIEARDGREAIRVAAGYPSRIDLLITDMVMPNLGGSELFAHLRLLRPDLRVLFVSGYTDEDLIRRGLEDAGSAFLQKPFTAKALAAAAKESLAG
jgi:PAS domain S-box-containing protein